MGVFTFPSLHDYVCTWWKFFFSLISLLSYQNPMHPLVLISNVTITLTYSLIHEIGHDPSPYSSHSIWLVPLQNVCLISHYYYYYSNTFFCLFLKPESEILEGRGSANSRNNYNAVRLLMFIHNHFFKIWAFYSWICMDLNDFPCSHLIS